MDLSKYVIRGSAHNILGDLTYERVVNIQGGMILGVCRIGAFTYINGPTFISNCNIGRYGSVAGNVTINPGQHFVNLLSTHPVVCDLTDAVAGLSSFPEYKSVLCQKPITVPLTKRMGAVTIGNDVWIGCNVVILGGVSIGDGDIVAAVSIVAKDVQTYSVVAGNHAREVSKRFDEFYHSGPFNLALVGIRLVCYQG